MADERLADFPPVAAGDVAPTDSFVALVGGVASLLPESEAASLFGGGSSWQDVDPSDIVVTQGSGTLVCNSEPAWSLNLSCCRWMNQNGLVTVVGDLTFASGAGQAGHIVLVEIPDLPTALIHVNNARGVATIFGPVVFVNALVTLWGEDPTVIVQFNRTDEPFDQPVGINPAGALDSSSTITFSFIYDAA